MALAILKNEVDSLREDQNQKLLANHFFISERGDYYADVWYFSGENKITKIDFTVFDLSIFNLDSSAIFHNNGNESELNSKEYAKLFCSVVLTSRSYRAVQVTYQMLMHIFAFLKENDEIVLDASLLERFWTSFMARTINENGFSNRISTPSYLGTIRPVAFPKLRNELLALGVKGVIDQKLTQKKIEKSLDEVCRSQYSVTLNEFKKSGSFNFLGLELGQYYIDYLNHVYQTNFFYTLICKKAISTMLSKLNTDIIKNASLRNRLTNVIFGAILGEDFDKSRISTNGINHLAFKAMTEEALIAEYNQHFESTLSLREENIRSLVIDLRLSDRFDAVEVIRVLMLKKYMGLNGNKSADDIWNSYLSSLDKSFIDSQVLNSVCADDVYNKMRLKVSKQRLTDKECLIDVQQWAVKLMAKSTSKVYKEFKKLLNTQLHAMTALFVAWTGYRKSEYGFPLSAIYTEANSDILDSAHVPFRFKLKWLVPKTNGTTKINREVTSQCYQVAAQLNKLFCHENDDPCLYSLTGTKKKADKPYSEVFIESRVKANWSGFISDYQPFNEVIRLDELTQKAVALSLREKNEIEDLSVKYCFGSARYKQLLSSAKNVRNDWLRLSLTSFNGSQAQKRLKQSLIAYIQGIPIQHEGYIAIFDMFLSSETKSLLQSGSIDIGDVKTIRDINSELLEGVRYPSAHSFRHIWAEAVLTRYQGDVGAVIRHQFCHLDNSYFMAYLREKDARGLMASAKQRYLNSIVELLIIESGKYGEKHLGGFSRFVKRAAQLTQVKKDEELLALRDKIAGRIIHLQSSRFAMCIPRDGGEGHAKCAIGGKLNPQDAKLEFCLDCINSWITEGNIRGIWQTIQPMVIEAMQPNGIGFLLESHLPALTSSRGRINDLRNNRNRESVDKILSAIDGAVSSIRNKIAAEEIHHG